VPPYKVFKETKLLNAESLLIPMYFFKSKLQKKSKIYTYNNTGNQKHYKQTNKQKKKKTIIIQSHRLTCGAAMWVDSYDL